MMLPQLAMDEAYISGDLARALKIVGERKGVVVRFRTSGPPVEETGEWPDGGGFDGPDFVLKFTDDVVDAAVRRLSRCEAGGE